MAAVLLADTGLCGTPIRRATMTENKFDFEKDYLVITRDRQGAYRSFRWYPSVIVLAGSNEKSEVTLSEIEAKIVKWNEYQQKPENDGLMMELVTDTLAREICAYREYARPLEDIINDARKIQESIDNAVEYLDAALDNLNSIRGLG
jgi:hypothetical protein